MIYFDNAATTRPNMRAVEQSLRYLQDEYFNPSAIYMEGLKIKNELKAAREELISYLADKEQFNLIFTSCGTEADNQVLFSYGLRGNVVTTEGEHSAIFAAAGELKQRGIDVRFAKLNSDGSVNVDHLLSLVDGKTSLVSVIHVNNEIGAINDVNAIAKRVKSINPRTVFHSDGVQAFGKLPYRIGEAVDAYSFSAHKIGGIKGIGGLYIRKKYYAALRPYILGGGQENGKRSGTENVFQIMQLRYAAKEKYSSLRGDYERVENLREKLWSLLDKTAFQRLSSEGGTPYILSVTAEGVRGEVLLHMLDDRGLIVGTGSACSSNAQKRYSRVMLACGLKELQADGVLRLSFSNETTAEEIEQGAKILNECVLELRKRMNV